MMGRTAGVTFSKRRLLSVMEVQRHILRNGGVVTAMLMYPDFAAFFRKNPRGVYKTPTGYPVQSAIGHAIFCLGWNDVEEWWYCKNSWGPKFADNGFFRVCSWRLLAMAPVAATSYVMAGIAQSIVHWSIVQSLLGYGASTTSSSETADAQCWLFGRLLWCEQPRRVLPSQIGYGQVGAMQLMADNTANEEGAVYGVELNGELQIECARMR
jgi:Papain family cysteine protease